jgi:hypothetical protein
VSLSGARSFLLRRRGIADGSTRLRPVQPKPPARPAPVKRVAKAPGTCRDCPAVAAPDRLRCEACLKRNSAITNAAQKKLRADRMAAGLCALCEAPTDRPRCGDCRANARPKNRSEKRAAIKARREAGVCCWVGCEVVIGRAGYCDAHRERRNAASKAALERRIQAAAEQLVAKAGGR